MEKTQSWFWPLAALMIGAMCAVQFVSVAQESQTYDEGQHLAAGYAYLKAREFRVSPEHPALMNALNALPLLALGAGLPNRGRTWDADASFRFSDDFMYRNRVPADRMLMAGRSISILATALLAIAVAAWTRAAFGAPAALLAVFLCASDPNLIAHGRYITTDIGNTLFIFLAVVTWVRFLRTGRNADLALASAVFGLAMAVKYSAISVLAVHWVLLGLARWQRPASFPIRRMAAALVLPAAAAVLFGALLYAPEGFRDGIGAHPWFRGWLVMTGHTSSGQAAYLLGRGSITGWWYYFPVAFAVKTPAAVLLLLGVTLVAAAMLAPRVTVWDALRKADLRWAALVVPPLVLFGLSLKSSLNIGLRHILPVYPFLFILAAALLFHPAGARLRRARMALLVGVVGLQLFEAGRIHPYYLSFFNALVGGPERGSEYLVDSNLDWGQDLKRLKPYLESIGHRGPIYMEYFGQAKPEYYGIEFRPLPPESELPRFEALDGVAVISATYLRGLWVPYERMEWFRRRRPDARLGYSLYVYDLRRSR